eukprot:CAMPEP_0113901380 /NCGR_PEP_ID=MMETSP0780_2-20120614/21218_1 /TAXON_ID=652834 /ORGANISM="Palpitomonas bilix" /LENGTH=209 /DNA_ID=CAMNT_0000893979 /DNA_START=196 /DNA_END=822 /DNA_ORIENTATION=- /assembly_acc=CAM_ASM_000599
MAEKRRKGGGKKKRRSLSSPSPPLLPPADVERAESYHEHRMAVAASIAEKLGQDFNKEVSEVSDKRRRSRSTSAPSPSLSSPSYPFTSSSYPTRAATPSAASQARSGSVRERGKEKKEGGGGGGGMTADEKGAVDDYVRAMLETTELDEQSHADKFIQSSVFEAHPLTASRVYDPSYQVEARMRRYKLATSTPPHPRPLSSQSYADERE